MHNKLISLKPTRTMMMGRRSSHGLRDGRASNSLCSQAGAWEQEVRRGYYE